jgi:hypothetical protein
MVTKHMHLEDVTAGSLRKMLHWQPNSVGYETPAATFAHSDDDIEDDEGSSGSSAGWQVLESLPLMALHPTVRQLLADGTKKQLQKAGFNPLTSRARARDDAVLLQLPGVLAGLSYKLGRRPVAAAVPVRLSRALGVSGQLKNGRFFAENLPTAHRPLTNRPPEQHGDVEAEMAGSGGVEVKTEGGHNAGSSRQLASSAEETAAAAAAGATSRAKRARKRRLVLDDSDEDGSDEPQQQPRKRQVRPSGVKLDCGFKPAVSTGKFKSDLQQQHLEMHCIVCTLSTLRLTARVYITLRALPLIWGQPSKHSGALPWYSVTHGCHGADCWVDLARTSTGAG